MSNPNLHPEHAAHPATVAPPLKPWRDFDLTEENDRALAAKLIAEILMDDEWHHREDILDEIAYECELPAKPVRKLLSHMRSHGDIRADGDWMRITTRWRSYAGEQGQAAA